MATVPTSKRLPSGMNCAQMRVRVHSRYAQSQQWAVRRSQPAYELMACTATITAGNAAELSLLVAHATGMEGNHMYHAMYAASSSVAAARISAVWTLLEAAYHAWNTCLPTLLRFATVAAPSLVEQLLAVTPPLQALSEEAYRRPISNHLLDCVRFVSRFDALRHISRPAEVLAQWSSPSTRL